MTLNGVPPTILQHETVWLDSSRFQDAERQYHELNASKSQSSCSLSSHVSKTTNPTTTIAAEIANARQKIKNLMNSKSQDIYDASAITTRLEKVESEVKDVAQEMMKLTQEFNKLFVDVNKLFKLTNASSSTASLPSSEDKKKEVTNGPTEAEDDDDVDLFGSDEETEEEARLKEERVKAYTEKKSKKPALVAKSSVVLDVKPWDDETDMKALENAVRSVQLDGLVWGAGKLVPLAYGINKFQIVAVVEDEKVSIDLLQENIEGFEELVQSVDIAAFNKL